ncbi:MAG: hypothetical protein JXA77_00605 [Bacteroidales bacterium]|nr:hypothetical protein [Bacteroidales bacterium]MBN2817327.1 hypothetical protein [Bacteroidales bacterium]
MPIKSLFFIASLFTYCLWGFSQDVDTNNFNIKNPIKSFKKHEAKKAITFNPIGIVGTIVNKEALNIKLNYEKQHSEKYSHLVKFDIITLMMIQTESSTSTSKTIYTGSLIFNPGPQSIILDLSLKTGGFLK